MWDGYPEYEKLCKKYDVKHIHVSGHVYEQDLKRLIEELKPDNTVIIHTEHPQESAMLLQSNTKVILPEIHKKYQIA